ncbi:MAG: hypothetical protein ACP5IA_00340 [Sediminispirochaetaceae bacterium]
MGISYLIFMIADMVLAIPMWKIGRKCGQGLPYWRYCIPIYNLVLLCRCAGIPVYILFAAMGLSVLVPIIGLPSAEITWLISFLFFGYLSSALAGRLGKHRRLWFIAGGLLFFIPLFVFGFDTSTPQ